MMTIDRRVPTAMQASAARRIARCAVRALYAELTLEPKPGLVSLRDAGSHTDMTADTFVRSLFALRHYFGAIARAGARAQPLSDLQALGLAAEQRMLVATAGVNTHRGAVFVLGLLCAAAGRLVAQKQVCTPARLRHSLLENWGPALQQHAAAQLQGPARSHGQQAARRFRLRGAAAEAALGFPTLFEVTLPALQAGLQAGRGARAARVQALFATMAVLDDTNAAHRCGLDGLLCVQRTAADFLRAGGVDQPDWIGRARTVHADWVAQRLSPGGAADVLAAACWLHEWMRVSA